MSSNLEVFSYNQFGANGLNTQEASIVLSSNWASTAENVEFDREGRLSPRPVFVDTSFQPSVTTFTSIHAYNWNDTGGFSFETIFAIQNGYSERASSISGSYSSGGFGTVSSSQPNSKMMSVRLQDRVFFFSRGTRPQTINLATGGALANVTDAAAPQAHIAYAAFGRIWAADTGYGSNEKRTLYWSVLLNGNDWSGTGSGSLDLTSYWGTSDDEITSIREFNNFLIVFSLKRITIIENPDLATFNVSATTNPNTTMAIKDAIVGVGAIGRYATINVGDDIVFMDQSGLYSLSRVIQEKSNPLTSICPQVQDTFRGVASIGRRLYVQSPYGSEFKLLYNQYTKQIYMFTGSSTNYVVHMGRRVEGLPCVTSWTGLTVRDVCLYMAADGNIYLLYHGTWTGSNGIKVGLLYDTSIPSLPSVGSNYETYTATIAGTWDVLGKENVQKHLKRSLVTYKSNATTYTFKYKFNFDDATEQTFPLTVVASGSSYKVASLPIGGSGETVLMTVSWPITQSTVSNQLGRIVFNFKTGRINSGV
jgi:hypothetical protein